MVGHKIKMDHRMMVLLENLLSFKKLKEKNGWDWNKKAKAYDKNPTIQIVNDRGDILVYVTSTSKIKYYSRMGYNSFYFMPNYNIKYQVLIFRLILYQYLGSDRL
jgi:hypothetical protein